MRTESHASRRICHSIWQQSVALYLRIWRNLGYCVVVVGGRLSLGMATTVYNMPPPPASGDLQAFCSEDMADFWSLR